MKLCISSYLWLIPFIFFFSGYALMRVYFAPKPTPMPALVGMNATDALVALSEYQLTPHILAHKEDHAFPAGTVLEQIPTSNQMTKPRQLVFLILSTSCQNNIMPSYIHKTENEIRNDCKKRNMIITMHHITHEWPEGHCFAQWPSPGTELTSEVPLVYVAATQPTTVIWPNFVGHRAENAISFLESYGITPTIIGKEEHNNQTIETAQVTDQRPHAGSFICIDNPEQIMTYLCIK